MLELGLGNVVLVMIASLGLYLLFEYPFKRMLELTLLKSISLEESLLLAHVRRNMSSSKTATLTKQQDAKAHGLKDTSEASIVTGSSHNSLIPANAPRDSFE